MLTNLISNGAASYLRWGAVAFFAIFLFSSLLYFYFLRQVRFARYYVLRERARRAGGRWLTIAVISLVLGMVALYLHCRIPSAPSVPLYTVTASVSEVLSPAPEALLSPSPTYTPRATAIPSPTPLPTSTPIPTPTSTPTPVHPLPETALTPKPGATPAPPDARITLLTFARDQENGRPVDPGDTFPPGDHRVYLFFTYEGMRQGVVWTYGWYHEGRYLDGNTCLWGVVEETCPQVFGEKGSTFLFFNPRAVETGEYPNGYVPGTYEVRVWIEDRFQGSLSFTIAEEGSP